MNSHDLDKRNRALLHRRLLAAPTELRAMATAENVGWEVPDFAADTSQWEAIYELLRACSDARSAVLGCSAEVVPDEESEASENPIWTERLIALDRAIAAAVRAGRLLRQRGVKPTLALRERNAADTDHDIPVRADLGFRLLNIGRRVA